MCISPQNMANSNSESINDNDISKSKNHASSLQNSPFAIMDMLARGELISQAIYIAAKFRIADYLKNGPKALKN
jgi:hypothetical protein